MLVKDLSGFIEGHTPFREHPPAAEPSGLEFFWIESLLLGFLDREPVTLGFCSPGDRERLRETHPLRVDVGREARPRLGGGLRGRRNVGRRPALWRLHV